MKTVTLVGTIKEAGEMKESKAGNAYCTFKVETSEKWEDNIIEETFPIIAFGKTAEKVSEVSVGSLVEVVGKLRSNNREHNEKIYYDLSISANSIEALRAAIGAPEATQAGFKDDEIPF